MKSKKSENKQSRASLVEQYRSSTPEELLAVVKDADDELLKLRFRHAVRQLENPARFRLLKKKIARVKTILNERARVKALEQKAAA